MQAEVRSLVGGGGVEQSREMTTTRPRGGVCVGAHGEESAWVYTGSRPPGCTQEVCVGPRGCVQGGVRVGVQFRAFAYLSLEPSLRDNILSRP